MLVNQCKGTKFQSIGEVEILVLQHSQWLNAFDGSLVELDYPATLIALPKDTRGNGVKIGFSSTSLDRTVCFEVTVRVHDL